MNRNEQAAAAQLPPSRNQTARQTTGIPGLDDILFGGLPRGQMYLLEGDPGTGKTTIAMQFMLAGLALGERCLYVTLSEPRHELEGSAESHGWSLKDLPIVEFVPDEASLSSDQQYTVFHPSEVELAGTIQRLIHEIERVQPSRLVIDSLSEMRLLAADSMRYRRQLLALKQYLSGRNTTVLLLDDRTGEGHDLQLQSIAHGVMRLEKIPRSYGITRRRIEVVKLRGSAFREGYHDYNIHYCGVTVYPRLIASEHEANLERGPVSSGLAPLDTMLGGGLTRGSSTLLIGPSGSGKSSLAMQFAYAAAQRGERAIVYAFDEVSRIARARAEGLGLDLKKHLDRGTLCLSQVDPAELSPGEFVWQIREDIANNNTRVVVIDSLNGFLNSMPGELDLVLHLHELLAFLNQKGIVTLLVMTQHGMFGSMHSVIDVSYLSDTVILIRYFEAEAAIRQSISVLKKRVGGHERTLRELRFSDGGIHIGEPLTAFRGVLTGVPEMVGGGSAPMKRPGD